MSTFRAKKKVDKRADNLKDCHSEQSEESFVMAFKILRAS